MPGFQHGNREVPDERKPLLRRSAPWQGTLDRLPTKKRIALLESIAAADPDLRAGRQVHVN